MSFFAVGYKFDVFFLDIIILHFLVMKSLAIINGISNKKKRIIFIISKLNWKNSRFLKKKKKIHKYLLKNIRNLNMLTVTKWVYGILSNFKRVNKKNKVLPLKIVPNAVFMLTSKIQDNLNYLNIIKEAFILNILTFGLVDTDQNPVVFNYPVPCNSKAYETGRFFYRLYASYFFICNLKLKSDFFKILIIKQIKKKKKKNEQTIII